MFDNPPHQLRKQNNPMHEYFHSIDVHFSNKTTAADGRISRQNYTNTITNIKKKKKDTTLIMLQIHCNNDINK